MSRRILNGWKEISGHIERSARTAQRWEAQMGMPVHRPAVKDGGVVVAFTDELDNWICGNPPHATPHAGDKQPALPGLEPEEKDLLRVLEDMSTLVWDTAELAARMRLLQEQLRQSLRLYRHQFASGRMARKALLGRGGLGSLLNFPVVNTDTVARELTEQSQAHEPYIR